MIIFLYGADTFRARRLLQEMKAKFIKDVDSEANSLGLVDGQTATTQEISEKINTGSLFVKKRLIVVENIFKNKKAKTFPELLDYLKKLPPEDDNVIIFIDEELDSRERPLKAEAKKLFAFLSRQKYVQEFKLLSGAQLLAFIKKEAAAYGKSVGVNAASQLINLSNGDLWLIASELKKLAFFVSGQTISEGDVRELCNGQANEDIFALTDAWGNKNKALAIKLLEEQYAAGLSDEYIISMLVRQTKILLQVKAALDQKIDSTKIAGLLKLHPFVVKKGAAQARNFSQEKLKNMLDQLIRLDSGNKSGRGQIRTELLLLFSNI